MSTRLSPKASRVVTHVRGLIVDRRLGRGDALPTERELARNLSMGHMTVRRGLSLLVDEGVIERRTGCGTFVAETMGLRSHSGPDGGDAKAFRAAPIPGPSRVLNLAMVVQDNLANMPQIAYGLEGLRTQFTQARARIEILTMPSGGFRSHSDHAEFVKMVAERQVEGLVLQGHVGTELFGMLQEAGIRVVSLGQANEPAQVPHVANNHEAVLDSVVHEAYRFGHRQIALLDWISPSKSKVDDVMALHYRRACRARNLLEASDTMVPMPFPPSLNPDDVDLAPFYALTAIPTCMIVPDDVMATALCRALQARGHRVPDDVSIIARFDGAPNAHLIPLSAPDGPSLLRERFALAAELLSLQLNGDVTDLRRVHTPRVAFKASLGPAPR